MTSSIFRCLGAASKKLQLILLGFHSYAVATVALSFCLVACSSTQDFISVEERFKEPETTTDFHRVKKGETLYSIAWRYGVDFKKLASANSIRSPYTIIPGQKLDLRAKPKPISTAKKPPVRKTSKPRAVKKTTVHKKDKKIQKATKESKKPTIYTWVWPLSGTVVKGFSSKKEINKGVDIKPRLGESVLAARAGHVVYAGQGLRGYGNLIIIKHDDEFLSAYAHTSEILVQENQAVQKGQKIAKTGQNRSGASVHFEIRRYGKPVNPLTYLPKR